MSEPREPLRHVVIAGGGQVGALAAIAVKRALPGCNVTVLGLRMDPSALADSASTALPFSNELHERLGIVEEDLVRRAGASHRLVTHYFGWGGQGQHGYFAHGAGHDPALANAFAREWGAGPRNQTREMPAGSLEQALATAGRFCVPPPGMQTPLQDLSYALRWNGPAYRQMLVEIAQSLGVVHVQAQQVALEPDGQGGIASIAIQGGELLRADLFVDCSGPSARLLSALPQYARESWENALPVRHLIHAHPGEAMIALEDRITLLPEGWVAEIAGRDGLQTVMGVREGVAEQAALAALRQEPAAVLPVSPGRARQAWIGNVIALGDAAATFEPLAALNLDLAHRQIDLLVEMLPGRTFDPVERAEFNRRAAMMADTVRDTLSVHYAAPAARDTGDLERSAALLRLLDQFTRRGRVPFAEDAPLASQEMAALLRALGYRQGEGPILRSSDPAEAQEARQRFDAKVRAALEFAPPYAQWLAREVGAPAA